MNVDTIIIIVFVGAFALFILVVALRERLGDIKKVFNKFRKASKK